MFVATSKAFFPDPAAGSIEHQYAPMLRETLNTELMVRGVSRKLYHVYDFLADLFYFNS